MRSARGSQPKRQAQAKTPPPKTNEGGGSDLCSAPTPAAASDEAASADLLLEAYGRPEGDQQTSGVKNGDCDAHIAHFIQADTT